MGSQSAGALRVLRAGADNDRNSCFDQMLDSLHPLFVGQQGPIPHGSAIDHGGHAVLDEFLAHFNKGGKIRRPVGFARGHQGGHNALENRGGHKGVSFVTRN